MVGGLAGEPMFPPLEHFEPGTAIRLLAERDGVPLSGFGERSERDQLAPGDRCVVLVTLRDGRDTGQWLIDFRVDALNADEVARVAAMEAPGLTLHTSTGRELRFGHAPVAMEVAIAGPLDEDEARVERAVDRVERKQARLLVNGEFLGLGLDRMAATIMRLRDGEGKVGFGLQSGEPFPAAEATANRERLDGRGVTADDERAMAGAVPALLEFFGIAAQTPGLQEILFKVVDVPWWALVRSLGNVSTNLELQGGRIRETPETPGGYVVPITVTINRKLALLAELVVEPPQPPGAALAGITAIFAGQPDGRGPRVSIELLATETARASVERDETAH